MSEGEKNKQPTFKEPVVIEIELLPDSFSYIILAHHSALEWIVRNVATLNIFRKHFWL